MLLLEGALRKEVDKMDEFREVANDIIQKIDSLHYEEKEKRFIQTEILFNLYKMFESKEHYRQDIAYLAERNNNQRLVYKNKQEL